MVLSKAFWLVGLGVLIGRLDGILREYDNEEFFNSFGSVFFALRWCCCCSFSYLLQTQSLDLSSTICALEPIIHLRTVWYCEPAMTTFLDVILKKEGASQGHSASELISKRIAELGDWRRETLSKMRTLIK
jgi:hypothetical protein